jgi:hypothetical protein
MSIGGEIAQAAALPSSNVVRDCGAAALVASTAELCRERWYAMAGTIPDEASAMIARGEDFFATLLLLEAVTVGRLVKWRAAFSSAGGAYEFCFWVGEQGGVVRQFCGHDGASLTLSLVAALEHFRTR